MGKTFVAGEENLDQPINLGRPGEPFYRLRLMPDGTILKGDGQSAPVPFSSGPSGPVPGQIIGSTRYAPATQVLFSTNSATPVTLDAANLSVGFTVPVSGAVVVTLSAFLHAAGSTFPHWGLTEGGVLVPGSTKRVSHGTLHNAPAYTQRIIGLAPGSVKSWAWAQWSQATASVMNLYAGAASTNDELGSAYMEVRAG